MMRAIWCTSVFCFTSACALFEHPAGRQPVEYVRGTFAIAPNDPVSVAKLTEGPVVITDIEIDYGVSGPSILYAMPGAHDCGAMVLPAAGPDSAQKTTTSQAPDGADVIRRSSQGGGAVHGAHYFVKSGDLLCILTPFTTVTGGGHAAFSSTSGISGNWAGFRP